MLCPYCGYDRWGDLFNLEMKAEIMDENEIEVTARLGSVAGTPPFPGVVEYYTFKTNTNLTRHQWRIVEPEGKVIARGLPDGFESGHAATTNLMNAMLVVNNIALTHWRSLG